MPSTSGAVGVLLLATLAAGVGKPRAGSALNKIKHVVVLMEENRSFDHLFGYYNGTTRGVLNQSHPVSNSVFNKTTGRMEEVPYSPTAPYLNLCDPDHSVPATTTKIYNTSDPTPGTPDAMAGFAQYEYTRNSGEREECNVMQGFPPERVPVMTALAENFVLMDNFFCSVPGPTWPNRLFFLTGTSEGMTETGTWYQNMPGRLFPSKSIFDQVEEGGGDWAQYYDDAVWELFLHKLADNPDNLKPMDEFYASAKAGTLPSFSFMNPRSGVSLQKNAGSNDMHPDHDVALSEALYRDVYQALRSSPAWEDTLFIITFDEHGGFYDHVSPLTDIPAPVSAGGPKPSYPDTFDFTRSGVRIPTLVISPWVAKGRTVSDPPAAQKPMNNSGYDLTSIIATARKLLDPLQNAKPLTARDAWAATFEHIFEPLATPRTDCPTELPLPPQPTRPSLEHEADLPLNSLQQHIVQTHADLLGEPFPASVSKQGHVSDYLSKALDSHRKKTAHWKRAKATASARYPMVVSGQAKTGYVNSYLLTCVGTAADQACTIALNITSGGNVVEYCVDGAAMGPNSAVSVAPCLPSSNPSTNRDPSQLWLRPEDSTFRPKNASNLCVTNALQDGGFSNLFLSPCAAAVTQHYIWFGPGATMLSPGKGSLSYGPYGVYVETA